MTRFQRIITLILIVMLCAILFQVVKIEIKMKEERERMIEDKIRTEIVKESAKQLHLKNDSITLNKINE